MTRPPWTTTVLSTSVCPSGAPRNWPTCKPSSPLRQLSYRGQQLLTEARTARAVPAPLGTTPGAISTTPPWIVRLPEVRLAHDDVPTRCGAR